MPTILDPNAQGRVYALAENAGYKYPKGLDMRPTSQTHARLLKEVYLRALESSREMSKRYDSWKKVDKTLTAYIKMDESETIIKKK